jgi:hypothetical protein
MQPRPPTARQPFRARGTVDEFELDEMVFFGGREVPLGKALVEYVQVKKQAGASALTGPICFRQFGKKPGALDAAQMDQIIAAIPAEDSGRGDAEG